MHAVSSAGRQSSVRKFSQMLSGTKSGDDLEHLFLDGCFGLLFSMFAQTHSI